jgi:hypothetical protein
MDDGLKRVYFQHVMDKIGVALVEIQMIAQHLLAFREAETFSDQF